MLKHASRSRHIDPDRPPAAAGGLRYVPGSRPRSWPLGSCSTAASCSRLVDENGPAPSTGGRGRASTWQLQLSHWAVRASTDEQRTGYALGVAIVPTAQRTGATNVRNFARAGQRHDTLKRVAQRGRCRLLYLFGVKHVSCKALPNVPSRPRVRGGATMW